MQGTLQDGKLVRVIGDDKLTIHHGQLLSGAEGKR